MSLTPGTHLGPYEIDSLLGAGGMGEVYRARDTRLGRDVAIKVLPVQAATDLEARQRLDREARAVSSLSHPHICPLYDVGHQDGVDFLVMEYLEGETLAARLTRGPLPLTEAIQHGAQVADALSTAHTSGIVHRDVKPSNIFLTETGGLKMLDFGLARAAEAVIGARSPEVSTHLNLTTPGSVVGTTPYMSPEHARGYPVDARADVWAFGCVLYEMLTLVSTGNGAGPVALSPDGTRAAFVAREGEGRPRLWIRQLADATTRPVVGTDGASMPFWSPDSRRVGFFADRRLKTVPIAGGPISVLAEAADARGGSWSRDGVIVYAPSATSAIFSISELDGSSPKVITPQKDVTHRYPWFLPDGRHFLYLARQSTAGGGQRAAIFAKGLDDGEPVRIVDVASNVAYAANHLIYVRNGVLMAHPFDPNRLHTTGEPRQIVANLRMDERFSRGVFSVSENGLLAFETGTVEPPSSLAWLDRSGRVTQRIA